jgi:putative membrane protein
MGYGHRQKSPIGGIVLGSLSGIVGTILMTQFQILWKKASKDSLPQQRAEKSKKPEKEDSTVKTARKISEAAGHKLTRAEKKKAGNWVHFGFGASMGAIYGLARELAPRSLHRLNPAIAGAGYGSAVFLGAHEIAVPALRLGSNPLKEPAPDQISHYLAHLVYGIGTSLTYSALRQF